MHPKVQEQHRLGQVYLKQFGYQDNAKKWWVSVLKLGQEYTEKKSIKSFTKEPNIFDLPLKDMVGKRLFESMSGELETHYPKVVAEIEATKRLSEESWGLLLQFMVNLLCKTKPYRAFIQNILESEQRNYFLDEIMLFFSPEEKKHIIETTNKLPLDKQLNPIMIPVCIYLIGRLGHSDFSYVVFEDYDNRGWITTDNPVVLLNDIDEFSILSIQTEVYFPISKKYCLYMDHKSRGNTIGLRNEIDTHVLQCDEPRQTMIWDVISKNLFEHLIFPDEMGREKVSPD